MKAAENALPYSTDRVLSVMGVGDAIHIAVYYIAQVMLEHKEVLKKHKVVLYNPANYQPTDQSLGGRQRQPPSNSYNNPMGYQAKLPPFSKPPQHQQSPYNFSMMFQPAVQPQHFGSPVTSNPNAISPVGMQPSVNIPPQNQFTDEFGNTIVGEVITTHLFKQVKINIIKMSLLPTLVLGLLLGNEVTTSNTSEKLVHVHMLKLNQIRDNR